MLNRSVFIYTWNPDVETFQKFSLDKKVADFKAYVTACQRDFGNQATPDLETVCLIIAPELIFNPPHIQGESEAYSFEQNKAVEQALGSFSKQLDERMFVIAGAIRYTTEDDSKYKITSYVLSKNAITSYDKKRPTGPIEIGNNQSVPMEEGTKSGVFEFNGIRIGIEICFDHEFSTLKNEAGIRGVDIHVLIANGQNKREGSIASRNDGVSIFGVVELEENKHPHLGKTFEPTAFYTVSPQSLQSTQTINSVQDRRNSQEGSYRKRLNLMALGQKASMELNLIPAKLIGSNDSCITCYQTLLPIYTQSPRRRNSDVESPRVIPQPTLKETLVNILKKMDVINSEYKLNPVYDLLPNEVIEVINEIGSKEFNKDRLLAIINPLASTELTFWSFFQPKDDNITAFCRHIKLAIEAPCLNDDSCKHAIFSAEQVLQIIVKKSACAKKSNEESFLTRMTYGKR
jgi:hypothetical protein